MSREYEEYFRSLQEEVEKLYSVARAARAKGLDPSLNVEPELTNDIAERIEKLIGPKGIGDRMRELEGMDRREMAFKVAEEIALGRFGNMEKVDAADQAVRTALAIVTEGVTVAPIQGIPEIRIKKNADGSDYLAIYFAGPIRPAGGTAQALTLVVADFVRRRLGIERFQPSDENVGRLIEEVRLYEEEVRRFQYHVTDKDLEFALKNLAVEATGVSTDPYEVSNYRNIPGIDTNRLRGGALIVVVDGIVGRARKLLGICETLNLEGWEWLSKIGQNHNDDSEEKAAPTASFMEEIIVGRPVFSFPNAWGGFRLRYGRARTTGLAAVGVHPATMIVLNRFLTTGVQLRIELPGKSASVTPVDTIEPPIVRLVDGSVRRIESEEEAESIYDSIESILSLGDVLINAGDFIQNNKNLLRPGYDENQWSYGLRSVIDRVGREQLADACVMLPERLDAILFDPMNVPTPQEAIALAEQGAPLHPRYTYNWKWIDVDELRGLRRRLKESWKAESDDLDLDEGVKRSLENILVPHDIVDGRIRLGEAAPILERCLALDGDGDESESDDSLELVRGLSGFDIREKAPVHVGARMGRPEKAKERKMSPYVHGLFPIGNDGGPQRDLLKIRNGKTTSVQIVNRRCPRCGARCFSVICPECGETTVLKYVCPRCGRPLETDRCPACNVDATASSSCELDVPSLFQTAWKHIGGQRPGRIKCVKSLMNRNRVPEALEKGLLRARYDLSVFKDGTLRFDLTDIPLTHFTPGEVGVPVERLRELGYAHDMKGEPLESPDQMLELKVQDIVLPEDCGDYLVKVSQFIDDLLTLYYGLEPYYKMKSRDDVIGTPVLGLAPHTSAATVGRVIGWTKIRSCYAHPLWHAAKRRNCDGDEDAIMLVMDPLLNFSREFLPEQSGGLMDAPLYVIPVLNPSEVDKEAHNVDVMPRYPPEFYRLCEEGAEVSEYAPLIDTIGRRLGTEAQFQGFSYTEGCSDINLGAHIGAYNSLKTMLDKLESQMELSEKVRAVDAQAVAQKVLTSHFMKDIVGNLRAFTRQRFRCTKCNRKYRRPPLKGVCVRCGGKLSLTVYKGGIEKYLIPALDLVKRYDLDDYYSDRLGLVRDEIVALFKEEVEVEKPEDKQFSLTDFMKD